MTLPRKGLGLLVVAALSAAALTSCGKRDAAAPPSAAIPIPAEIDVKPSQSSVDNASAAASRAAEALRNQERELEAVRSEAERAQDLADSAYSRGLEAGGEKARELAGLVRGLRERIAVLLGLKDKAVRSLEEAEIALAEARSNIFDLQGAVGSANFALAAQEKANASLRSSLGEESQKRAAAETEVAVIDAARANWRLAFLIAGGILLLQLLFLTLRALGKINGLGFFK